MKASCLIIQSRRIHLIYSPYSLSIQQQQQDTLVLSETAKRYIIARKMRELLDREWQAADIAVNIVAMGVTINALNSILTKTFLASAATTMRAGAILAVLSTGVMVANVVWTWLEAQLASRVNRSLKEDGYTQGAVEYLEKQMRRGQLVTKAWYPTGTQSLLSQFFQNDSLLSSEGETRKPHFSSSHSETNSPSAHLQFFQSA